MRASISKLAIALGFRRLRCLAGKQRRRKRCVWAAPAARSECCNRSAPNSPPRPASRSKSSPSLGSTGAIRALTDGLLDIAVPARPLKADESAAGLRQVAVLRTAYVMATSHSNPNGLKSADLAGIFAAEKPTWADGTPIRIILRPRSDTDTALLGRIVPRYGRGDRNGAPPRRGADRGDRSGQRRIGGAHAGLTGRNHHDPAQDRASQSP